MSKRCRVCSQNYTDEYDYCPICGKPTEVKRISKGTITAIIAIIIAAISITTVLIVEQTKLKNQREEISNYQLEKQIEEYRNTPTKYDIEIVSGWTWHTERNYSYIEGSVKNTSSKYISYYEIEAKYLDGNNNVVDTDWTNGTNLSPGDSQSFEIMHKYNGEYKYVRLEIRKVS